MWESTNNNASCSLAGMPARSYALHVTLCLMIVSLLAVMGCGGGSRGTLSPPKSSGPGRGQVTVAIYWAKGKSRLIPTTSKSVKVELTETSGKFIGSDVAPRPNGNGETTMLTFYNLEPGVINIRASACPNADGSGVAQAAGITQASVTASETTDVSLRMDSTIARLELIPNNPTIYVGGGQVFYVAAYDASNAVVLISPTLLEYTSDNPAILPMDAQGRAIGKATGITKVHVREAESGKTTVMDVRVAQPPFRSGKILVTPWTLQQGDGVREFDSNGNYLRTIPIPLLTDNDMGDVVTGQDGRIHVQHGYFTPYLDSYNPATNAWQQRPMEAWQTVSHGGLSIKGKDLFVIDKTEQPDYLHGIIRFNLETGEWIRFGLLPNGKDYQRLTMGWDGLLYATSETYWHPETQQFIPTRVHVFVPEISLEIRTIDLPINTAGLAVHETGDLYVAEIGTNRIIRYSSEGVELARKTVPEYVVGDIDMSLDDRLLISRSGAPMVLTDIHFSKLTFITTDPVGGAGAFYEPPQ